MEYKKKKKTLEVVNYEVWGNMPAFMYTCIHTLYQYVFSEGKGLWLERENSSSFLPVIDRFINKNYSLVSNYLSILLSIVFFFYFCFCYGLN